MKKKLKPFQVVNVLIMLFLIGITLYPMYYVVVASISDPILLKSHTGLLWMPLGEATLADTRKPWPIRACSTALRSPCFTWLPEPCSRWG